MTLPDPRRGEVWWTDFDPSIGGEPRKIQPAVIVSNDSSNKALNRVQVVPITSKVAKLYRSEAYVTLKGQRRKATADQVQTVSKLRLKGRIGALNGPDMDAVERALRTQLAL